MLSVWICSAIFLITWHSRDHLFAMTWCALWVYKLIFTSSSRRWVLQEKWIWCQKYVSYHEFQMYHPHRLPSPASRPPTPALALQWREVGPLTCQCGTCFNLGSRSGEPPGLSSQRFGGGGEHAACLSSASAVGQQASSSKPGCLSLTSQTLNLISNLRVLAGVSTHTVPGRDMFWPFFPPPPHSTCWAISLLLSLHFFQVGLLFALWFLLTQFPELGYAFTKSRG